MAPRNAARAEIAEDGREKQGQETTQLPMPMPMPIPAALPQGQDLSTLSVRPPVSFLSSGLSGLDKAPEWS